MVEGYLEGRSQRVCVGETTSEWTDIKSKVKQYADDTTLSLGSSDASEMGKDWGMIWKV